MSVTSTPGHFREWLPRLLSGQPHQIIPHAADPYLKRWYVIPRNPVLNIYVHQFLRSDDDRALHDHPWWFASIMLKGAYVETSQQPGQKRTTTYRCAPEYRKAGLDHTIKLPRNIFAFRPAVFRHRVGLFAEDEWSTREVPCWTLIITGRRIDSAEALRLGLALRVLPDVAAVRAAARESLGLAAAQSPAAVASAQQTTRAVRPLSTDDGLAFEAEAFAARFGTPDMLEGTAAFLEKRRAEFLGL